MLKKLLSVTTVGLGLAILTVSLTGCDGGKEAVKPDQLAPPPSEADEVADDENG